MTALEYALIAAVLSGALGTAVPLFGTSLRNVFMAIPTALNTDGTSISSGGSPSSGGPSGGDQRHQDH